MGQRKINKKRGEGLVCVFGVRVGLQSAGYLRLSTLGVPEDVKTNQVQITPPI